MAELGQAFMIGNCDVDRTVKKIARAISNLYPSQCIVACHSYELADRVVEECEAVGTKAVLLWSDHKAPSEFGRYSAVVTVPENLHRLRSAVGQKAFLPCLLFLFDPNGTTFRGRSSEEGGGHRAGNISVFRAGCTAMGFQMLPVICVGVPPNTVNLAASLNSAPRLALCTLARNAASVQNGGVLIHTTLQEATDGDSHLCDAAGQVPAR